MTKHSAGVLLYRKTAHGIEVLLGHPGGPFWAKKDEGSWSIPKGEYDETTEDALAAAKREFSEELGTPAPDGDYRDLGTSKQPNGKLVHIWAVEGDLDSANVISNTTKVELPRGSGRFLEFPEIDRAEWFTPAVAMTKMVDGQVPFIERLERLVSSEPL